MMTAHFEEALLKALHGIADQLKDISYGIEELTFAVREVTETLSKEEEHAVD